MTLFPKILIYHLEPSLHNTRFILLSQPTLLIQFITLQLHLPINCCSPIDTMASSISAPQETTNQPNRSSGEQALPSTPLEMSNLESRPVASSQPALSDEAHDTSSTLPLHESEQKEQELQSQPTTTTSPTAPSTAHSPLDRTVSTAIGPSSDQPMPVPKDTELTGPTLMITLLLTNGARHPFKLDAKYLSKRNVKATDDDPFNLSVYTLKELILREWREGMFHDHTVAYVIANTRSQNGRQSPQVLAQYG